MGRLAVAQAYAYEQYNLGIWYGKGQGVAQDYVRVHMWWNLAAAKGTFKTDVSTLNIKSYYFWFFSL